MAPSPSLRLWQIACEGFPIGPHAEHFVVDAIESGALLSGTCRPVGELRWRALKEEPAFAQALKRAARTVSHRPQRQTR